MTDGNNQILSMIDDIVERKMLSLDGLRAVDAVREAASDLAKRLDASEERYKIASENNARLSATVRTLEAQFAALNARRAAVEEREAKAHEVDKACAVAVAEARVYAVVFATVFKNTTVRESVNESVTRNGVSEYSGSTTTRDQD